MLEGNRPRRLDWLLLTGSLALLTPVTHQQGQEIAVIAICPGTSTLPVVAITLPATATPASPDSDAPAPAVVSGAEQSGAP